MSNFVIVKTKQGKLYVCAKSVGAPDRFSIHGEVYDLGVRLKYKGCEKGAVPPPDVIYTSKRGTRACAGTWYVCARNHEETNCTLFDVVAEVYHEAIVLEVGA
jgi:hypothetical protein